MALPSSGAISFSNINTELGVSSTTQRSLNDSAVRTLFGIPSGAIDMNTGHGKSNYTPTKRIATSNQTITVPSGATSATIKLFGAGGYNSHYNGGYGAYVIGNFAVQPGDTLYFGLAGDNYAYAANVVWKRSGTMMGWAIAGAGGNCGNDGDDGGDGWSARFGGAGGNASGIGNNAGGGNNSDVGWAQGGAGAAGVSYAGSGGGGCNNGSDGGGPWSYTVPSYNSGGSGGGGCAGSNANGGSGGDGGGGYYGGGGGGGGYGRDDYPNSADGGGGGGGGSSNAYNMTSVSSGVCNSISDPDRGSAGNPGNGGLIVVYV